MTRTAAETKTATHRCSGCGSTYINADIHAACERDCAADSEPKGRARHGAPAFRLPSVEEDRLRAKLAYCSGVLSASADVIAGQFPEMAKLLRKTADEADTTLSETRS